MTENAPDQTPAEEQAPAPAFKKLVSSLRYQQPVRLANGHHTMVPPRGHSGKLPAKDIPAQLPMGIYVTDWDIAE